MDDIASAADLSKTTLYNAFSGKDALFTVVVKEVINQAERFARELPDEFEGYTPSNVRQGLHDLGTRLALTILRPEVISLRRLLISESGAFPQLADEYFERAPGGVLVALAAGFDRLHEARLINANDGRRSAEHFAYLVAGAQLDRAILTGRTPRKGAVAAAAEAGVQAFLRSYECA